MAVERIYFDKIKELEAENKRLKQMQIKINEMRKDNEDRRNLAKQNKTLARNIKFQKSKRLIDKATKIIGTAGIKTERVLSRGGKKAFRGLQRYARFLEEQEKKQRIKNRKLKTIKKTKRGK